MQKQQWSIYVAEYFMGGGANPVKNAMLGKERYHSFVMLVDEATSETLQELHFGAFAADGTRVDAHNPLNILAAASDRLRLLMAFKRVADKTNVGRRLARLKGIQTGGRYTLDDVESERCFTGTPEEMMDLWNDACRAVITLNKTDTPFLAVGLAKPAINCRAGTEFVLEGLGSVFNPLAQGLGATAGSGRHLADQVPFQHQQRGGNLTDLLKENAGLAQKIFAGRPQARYQQPQPIGV